MAWVHLWSWIAQDIQKNHEGGGVLTAAGIIEMETGKGRAPVGQHPDQLPLVDILAHAVRRKGQPGPGKGSFDGQGSGIENQMALYPDAQFTVALLELAGVEAAGTL